MKLDSTDKKILKCLQENARMKLTEIGKKVKKPPSTVSERIKRLEEEGIIMGYTALLNSKKMDRGFTAFVFGQARLGKGIDLEQPGEQIAKIPEVLEVHFVTGEYDYLVKIKVKDQEEYLKVVKKIASCFGLRGQGMIVPKTFKETTKLLIR